MFSVLKSSNINIFSALLKQQMRNFIILNRYKSR